MHRVKSIVMCNVYCVEWFYLNGLIHEICWMVGQTGKNHTSLGPESPEQKIHMHWGSVTLVQFESKSIQPVQFFGRDKKLVQSCTFADKLNR